jgi:hypothetical protein
MQKPIVLTVFALFVLALCSPLARCDENAIFSELVKKGVPLTNGKTIKLPDPVMADGLDETQQLAILKTLTAANRFDSFLEGGINDWFELKKTATAGAKKEDSIGRQIDLYFVAEGKIETAAGSEFTKKLLNQNDPNAKSKAEFFTDDELKSRKLTIANTEKMKERYAHAFSKILSKVEVSGSGRGIKTVGADSIVVAGKLDPRFANDERYPNHWQSIANVGLGDPEKYSGLGEYIKITKLVGPVQRVFVEYHLVFDEPFGWFKGRPNLIVHLDEVYPKDVRKFRRDLLNTEK